VRLGIFYDHVKCLPSPISTHGVKTEKTAKRIFIVM